jgi:hypothetical protein
MGRADRGSLIGGWLGGLVARSGREDLTTFGLLLGLPTLPPRCYASFVDLWWIGEKGRAVERIVRVTLDVVGLRYPETVYEMVVGESVRRNSVRKICDLQLGEAIRQADIALALQIVEDVFTSAIGRTLGIYTALEL